MAENQNALSVKQEVANAISNTTIADSILAAFSKLSEQGQLVFPKGYNVGNELKLMYTSLSQNELLNQATKISIGEALTEAVIQGLEIEKKQCYFIVYKNKMTLFRSYYGDIAVAKRTGLVKEIKSRVIYDGDEFELETNEDGEDYITGHRTQLLNRDKAILGAYAWAELPNGKRRYCIMTWNEIQKNWSKSRSGGGVQKEFPQEMCKRTVIRRLVKMLFNTTPTINDDQIAIIGSYNRTTEEEYDNDYSKISEKKGVNNTIDFEEEDVALTIDNNEENNTQVEE